MKKYINVIKETSIQKLRVLFFLKITNAKFNLGTKHGEKVFEKVISLPNTTPTVSNGLYTQSGISIYKIICYMK